MTSTDTRPGAEPTAEEAASSSASAAATSARSSMESLQNKAGEMLDQGKVNTFVLGFKAGYPSLAEGRSDEEIKEILADTCSDIADGKSDDEAKAALAERVTNNGDKPSDMQTSSLYLLAKPLC